MPTHLSRVWFHSRNCKQQNNNPFPTRPSPRHGKSVSGSHGTSSSSMRRSKTVSSLSPSEKKTALSKRPKAQNTCYSYRTTNTRKGQNQFSILHTFRLCRQAKNYQLFRPRQKSLAVVQHYPLHRLCLHLPSRRKSPRPA